jgi:hypothetical protein
MAETTCHVARSFTIELSWGIVCPRFTMHMRTPASGGAHWVPGDEIIGLTPIHVARILTRRPAEHISALDERHCFSTRVIG